MKIVVVSALKSISTTITIMLWNVPQLPNTMKSSGAYNALMNELQEKYGSDYMKISSDRSLLPDYKSFQHVITECVRMVIIDIFDGPCNYTSRPCE